jgi:hypothetical protein
MDGKNTIEIFEPVHPRNSPDSKAISNFRTDTSSATKPQYVPGDIR